MSRYVDRNSIGGDLLWGALAGTAAIYAALALDQYLYGPEPAGRQGPTAAAPPGGHAPAHAVSGGGAQPVNAQLAPSQPHPVGMAVHYGVGAAMGALYGALYRRTPMLGSGHGLLYGLGMFTLENEGMDGLLSAAGRRRNLSWQAHARGAVAHGVFGVITDTLLRLFRRG